MAITDKEQGVWILDQVYNKINQGGIWSYDGIPAWFTMGKSTNGDSGLNTTESKSSPTQLPGTTWSKIDSTSGRGFRAVKTDGTAWAWGYNNVGQLGINVSVPAYSVAQRSSPCQIGTDTTWGSKFTSDTGNTLWIKTDGTLWSWGYNSRGELGQNTPITGWPLPNRQGCFSSPTQVGTDATWSDILTGGGSMGLKTDGTLWTWGSNYNGQLGTNTPYPTGERSSPVQVGTDTTWSKIGVAGGTKFAIKTDGTAWSWGGDQYGKQAQNTQGVALSSPTQIGTDTTWSQIVGSTYGLKTDGTFWAWGFGSYGRQGLNDQTARSSPTQVGTDTDWLRLAEGGGDWMGAIREG